MAIIFKSSKKRQKIFFWLTSIFIGSTLISIFFVVFPPVLLQPETGKEEIALPKINFEILDSDQVKNLEPFSNITVTDANIGRFTPFLQY